MSLQISPLNAPVWQSTVLTRWPSRRSSRRGHRKHHRSAPWWSPVAVLLLESVAALSLMFAVGQFVVLAHTELLERRAQAVHRDAESRCALLADPTEQAACLARHGEANTPREQGA